MVSLSIELPPSLLSLATQRVLCDGDVGRALVLELLRVAELDDVGGGTRVEVAGALVAHVQLGVAKRPLAGRGPDGQLRVVLVVVEEGDGLLHGVERLVDELGGDSIEFKNLAPFLSTL